MEDFVQFELHGTLVSSNASDRVVLPVHLLKVWAKKSRLALAARRALWVTSKSTTGLYNIHITDECKHAVIAGSYPKEHLGIIH
jgi:hypothetical protein